MGESEEILKAIYYDPNSPGGFGGVNRLYREALKIHPELESETVEKWLKGQDTYSNFKIPKRRFLRLAILVDRIDEQWQMDLMDMQSFAVENDGIRYLLVVVDILSRYAWVRPCLTKNADEIKNLIQDIFTEGRVPEKIQSDQGSEFKNRVIIPWFNSLGINFFTTTDKAIKCAIAERFIRTLRSRIYRYMYWKNSIRYVDDLQSIVSSYNRSYHRTIGIEPVNVNKENQRQIVLRIQRGISREKKRVARFGIGDFVKIPLLDGQFEKGTAKRWTDEVFRIAAVKRKAQRYVYKIKDLMDEPVTSIFYPEELNRVDYDPNKLYKIESILQERVNPRTRRKEYLVKWLGWPEKFNSWEENPTELEEGQPI